MIGLDPNDVTAKVMEVTRERDARFVPQPEEVCAGGCGKPSNGDADNSRLCSECRANARHL